MLPGERSERSVVILAGGRGLRLGKETPKAFRRLAGRSLLDRAVEIASGWSNDVWISAPTDLEIPPGPYRVVRDHAAFGPWAGPLVALASALEAVPRRWALALAVDMPLARHELLDHLWSRRDDAPTPAPGTPHHGEALGVVPWRAFGAEPLLALYRTEISAPLLAATHSGERAATRAVAALPIVRVFDEEIRRVDPEFRSFRNLNHPEDWERTEVEIRRTESARGRTSR